ncbi:patatin-like phospholipase family protein [Candidatus Peregrinibacteria bacterium]|nr:patatin-like phospholipase family protein [Candidatus Peregrinibacteria bacterium]
MSSENQKQISEKYPKIGFAFGSGAAKAICQFGILKRLYEENIPISYVTGSSMGAVVAAVFALGLDVDIAIEKALRYAEASNINNLKNFNFLHESVYKKDFTNNLLGELFADFTFEDCKIPLAVTAVDLESGKLVILDKGPIVPAVRASTSLPGVFEPVLMNGYYLVDGGLLEDCPIPTIRQKSQSDIVIGSYITDLKARQEISGYIYNKFFSKKKNKNFFESKIDKIKNDLSLLAGIVLRSLEILRIELWHYKLKEAKPDILIEINIEKVNLFDFKKTNDLIKIGEDAFDKIYPQLKKLIEQKKKELNGPGKNAKLES